MSDALLTTPEVAQYTKKPARTFERWRITGRGPRFIRCGREVRYRKSDIEAWLEQNTVTPGGEDREVAQ